MYKERLKLNNMETNSLMPKGAKDLNQPLSRENTGTAHKHVKRCSASCIIREMQIKTLRCHYTPIRMTEVQNTDTTKGCGGWSHRHPASLLMGIEGRTSHFRRQFDGFL